MPFGRHCVKKQHKTQKKLLPNNSFLNTQITQKKVTESSKIIQKSFLIHQYYLNVNFSVVAISGS